MRECQCNGCHSGDLTLVKTEPIGFGIWSGEGKRCLHLGAGRRRLPGWEHHGLSSGDGVDIAFDLREVNDKLDAGVLAPGVYDVIYGAHVVEHVGRGELVDALRGLRRLLKPGGKLFLSVPDFRELAELYVKECVSIWRIMGPLMGGQRDAADWHGVALDHEYLSWAMTMAGLVKITDWNAGIMLPGRFDDYSFAEINGRQISLCLVGERSTS